MVVTEKIDNYKKTCENLKKLSEKTTRVFNSKEKQRTELLEMLADVDISMADKELIIKAIEEKKVGDNN